jgi:hypothetical protein
MEQSVANPQKTGMKQKRTIVHVHSENEFLFVEEFVPPYQWFLFKVHPRITGRELSILIVNLYIF